MTKYSDLTTVLATVKVNHPQLGPSTVDLIKQPAPAAPDGVYYIWITTADGKVHERQVPSEAEGRRLLAKLTPAQEG